jgi:rubrerythrin
MRTRHALAAAAVFTAVGVLQVVGSGAPRATASAGNGPAVRQLLVSAAQTESAAYQQYYAYAEGAASRPDLANVWQTVAKVEHQDHWTHEQTLGNFYSGSDNVANLKTAIKQAQQTASQDTNWAARAPRGSAAAGELAAIAKRERADAGLLTQALAAVQHKTPVPVARAVSAVPISVSSQPHYSGSFYNELTGASNSALEAAAWNWSEYQWDAKTAVDTGQARLAKLFSALQVQEQYQSYSAISNVAGYVNGDAANLKASIASEQGAVDMYTRYATTAKKLGDPSLGHVLLSIRGDEIGHHQTFTAELRDLSSRS